jgi:serine protease Do
MRFTHKAFRLAIPWLTALLAMEAAAARREKRARAVEGQFWTEGPRHDPIPGVAPLARASLAPLIEHLKPAVVNIYASKAGEVEGSSLDDLFRDFFGKKAPRRHSEKPHAPSALGSGFVLSPDGYVVTNEHVVEGAGTLKVRLADEREYEAKIVGADSKLDVALLKLQGAKNLPSVVVGDSDGLRVGDWVVAIGNPFGLGHTVTAGIVSAKDRIIGAGPYDDFIQTDASINPGNSGGPLFNLRGEVIGINTAIHTGGRGIGFAIPVNLAKPVLRQLKATGKAIRGWLGVGVQHVTDELARQFRLAKPMGALVTQVYEDSPAAEVGLRPGDIIVEFKGRPISRSELLPRFVAGTPPGELAVITYVREGKRHKVTVRVAPWTDRVETLASGEAFGEKLGFKVQVAKSGLVVTEIDPSGPAADLLEVGDVILEVNRRRVRTLRQWNEQLAELQAGGALLLRILRSGVKIFVTLEIP